MPITALILSLTWGLALFVVRTAIQYLRTGATGIKGFRGRFGSLPWVAGTAATGGITLTFLAPVFSLFHLPGGDVLFALPSLHQAGTGIAVLGIAAGVAAQLSMGASWRVGVDQAERTELVTHGPFRWVRNPIFTSMGIYLLGLLLVLPTPVTIVAATLFAVGIHLQVRHVEEPYLLRTHGDAYRRYASATGRFVPGLGTLSSS
jgi:protein-S-isoprenylcysteine O-methyltransferase Ste14